jgi:hypothetical protein
MCNEHEGRSSGAARLQGSGSGYPIPRPPKKKSKRGSKRKTKPQRGKIA